jgi:hypothetical protein
MHKLTWILAAALASFAAPPASALQLQTLTAPDGGPQFADPDEKRPFSGTYERDGDRPGDGRPDSGFHFSITGGNRGDNPMFIPGFTVPRQFGPAIDPQTHDPYPR